MADSPDQQQPTAPITLTFWVAKLPDGTYGLVADAESADLTLQIPFAPPVNEG